jgi:hypothetical protein
VQLGLLEAVSYLGEENFKVKDGRTISGPEGLLCLVTPDARDLISSGGPGKKGGEGASGVDTIPSRSAGNSEGSGGGKV